MSLKVKASVEIGQTKTDYEALSRWLGQDYPLLVDLRGDRRHKWVFKHHQFSGQDYWECDICGKRVTRYDDSLGPCPGKRP